MRANILFVVSLFFAVWFTILTAVAWTRGKRLAAAILAVVAAIDLAFVLETLRR